MECDVTHLVVQGRFAHWWHRLVTGRVPVPLCGASLLAGEEEPAGDPAGPDCPACVMANEIEKTRQLAESLWRAS